MMLNAILSRLFGGAIRKSAADVLRTELGSGYYLEYTFSGNGMGGFRPVNLVLCNTHDPSFRRCLLDGNGTIQNFPGFRGDLRRHDLVVPLDHTVRFSFSVGGFSEGAARVSWTLQPDGRYFEDEDGFGAEKCEEIILYSRLNEKGFFTEPFHEAPPE